MTTNLLRRWALMAGCALIAVCTANAAAARPGGAADEELLVEKDQTRPNQLVAADENGARYEILVHPITLEVLKLRTLNHGQEKQADKKDKGEKTSHIFYPLNLRVELSVGNRPIHNYFTRHVAFENWLGDVMHVPVAFEPLGGDPLATTYVGEATDDGIDALYEMAETGNRWYWDTMRLENHGGTTALFINHIDLWVDYDLSSAFEEEIQIIDHNTQVWLHDGVSSIDLDDAAAEGRRKFAGYTQAEFDGLPDPLALAILDLGKSGSDGKHFFFEPNPKYDEADAMLCSEFVSWYYAATGFTVSMSFGPLTLTFDFDDVTGAGQMHTAFWLADRLYCYDGVDQRFEHVESGVPYDPQPGDFLERRSDEDKPEHAMMMMDWDPVSLLATVVNGPWPVTLRTVDIDNPDKHFCVGRID
jgi:hypothetical protein